MQLRNCEKVDQQTRDPERELASRELPVKRESFVNTQESQ